MLIKVGEAYKFHTPLGIWIGVVREVALDEVMLDQCSWMPDIGRMHECVRDGTYHECEPVGDGVVLIRTGIAIPWRHPLPSEAK